MTQQSPSTATEPLAGSLGLPPVSSLEPRTPLLFGHTHSADVATLLLAGKEPGPVQTWSQTPHAQGSPLGQGCQDREP